MYNLKIFVFYSLLLWHHTSGDEIFGQLQSAETANQDEVELYRQLFLRLNMLVKSNIELKADLQELKEETKHIRENCGSPVSIPNLPTTTGSEVISSTCFNGETSTSTPSAHTDFEKVYCFGNNWMVIQRRMDGSENFDRSWTEYKNGFGNVSSEFFIGLEKLHAITTTKPYELVILLKDFTNDVRYARYDHFQLGGEQEQYMLKELGHYSGNAGDSLRYHLKGEFSTKDRDNDEHPTISCAQKFGGGWWYKECHHSNLNGHYVHTDHDRSYASGIHWKTFRNLWYSLKYSQMMIRPKN